MKRQVLFLSLILFIWTNGIAQISFEEGYFIDENDERSECKIKNMDWKDNPSSFEYMVNETSEVKTAKIENTKEFGINGKSKYLRRAVKMDRSSDNIYNMSVERNPVLNEEILFLKVLIEGNASLYQYVEDNLTRFFYKINDSEINQLIYKSYLIHNRIVSKNNHYRQQLLNEVNCPEINMGEYETLGYNARDLQRIFVKYNECVNSEYSTFEKPEERDLFNFSVKFGLNISDLSIQHATSDLRDFFYDPQYSPRIGVDAELVLPFNKNKWTIFTEPTYRNFTQIKTIESSDVVGGTLTTDVTYTSIELPVGVRHYFFLSEKSKVFLGASLIVDFTISDSFIYFTRADGSELTEPLEVTGRNSLGLSLGYKYNDRISFDIRYQTGREILSKYIFWKSDFQTLSFTLGYSIF